MEKLSLLYTISFKPQQFSLMLSLYFLEFKFIFLELIKYCVLAKFQENDLVTWVEIRLQDSTQTNNKGTKLNKSI